MEHEGRAGDAMDADHERGSGGKTVDVRRIYGESPVPWCVQIPAGWMTRPTRARDDVAGFQGTLTLTPRPKELCFGKATFCIAPRNVVGSGKRFAQTFIDCLADHSMQLDDTAFVAETPALLGTSSWLLRANAMLRRGPAEGCPCDVRCRVAWQEPFWTLIGVVGPTRNVSERAWDATRRAFALMSASLVLTPITNSTQAHSASGCASESEAP